VVVVLRGTIDAPMRGRLVEAWDRALAPGVKTVLVDLRETTRLDAVALGTLVYAGRRGRRNGSRIVFAGANAVVGGVFALTGLHRVFRVETAAGSTL
jgi:anti-anti-sigma factor